MVPWFRILPDDAVWCALVINHILEWKDFISSFSCFLLPWKTTLSWPQKSPPHVLHMQPECAIFVKSSCVSSSDLPLQMYLMHLSKKIIFKMLRMICNVYSKFHFLTKLYFFLSISISLLGRSCLLAMTTTGTPLISSLFKNPKSFSRDSNILSLSLLSTTYTNPAVKKYCLRLLYLNMDLYPPPSSFFFYKKKRI